MTLKNYMLDIQVFPKAVILFKETSSLSIDRKARKKCLKILVSLLADKKNGTCSRTIWRKKSRIFNRYSRHRMLLKTRIKIHNTCCIFIKRSCLVLNL